MIYRKIAAIFAAGLLLSALAACGEPEDGENDDTSAAPHELVYDLELIDRDTGEDFAEYHDGHWHGQILLEPHADESDYLSFGFEFEDEDHNELDIPLGDDGYDYSVEIDDEEHVWYDTHSDHVHIRGEESGHTHIYFEFTKDGEVFFDTHAEGLPIVVDDDHDNHDNHDHDNHDDD